MIHLLKIYSFLSAAMVCLCCSLGFSQTNPEAPKLSALDETLIELLKSDSYATRQFAQWRLQDAGASMISSLEAACRKSDADLSEKLVYLLGELAADPESPTGTQALAALERIASYGVTLPGALASRTIDSIREQQREVVEDFIRQTRADLGHSLGTQIIGFDSTKLRLRIDDRYWGTADDLACLRWLSGVEAVVLEGKRIDRKWLERIVRMPDLRNVFLSRTSLRGQDLELLQSVSQLNVLAIDYSAIDDSCSPILKSLSIRKNLRLFGTQMTRAEVDKLAIELEGVDIAFGKGGFLGIKSNSPNEVVLTELVPGGAAERAGLMRLDRLVEIDGLPLNKFEELRNELSRHGAGESVRITFERKEDGELVTKSLDVTLKEQGIETIDR